MSRNNAARIARLAALQNYGKPDLLGNVVCSCCEEADERFLTIDHIHGCTKEQRKREGLGSSFYSWLKRNGYPSGYAVLCFNCNLGRAKNGGVCPHRDPMRLTPGRVKPFNEDDVLFGSLDIDLDYLG